MRYRGVLMSVSVLVLLVAGDVLAGRVETVRDSIDAQGAKRLVVDFDFGAGELYLVPRDMERAADLEITYDTRRVDYSAEYETKDDVGYLYLESKIRTSRNTNGLDNEWDVALSTRFPTELVLDMGACKADIDLGGIRLTDLDIDIGAASGTIDFSVPNPERIRQMKVEIGASSVEMLNIGNANFEYFSFSSGAASSELDFRGEYTGESEISLDIGLGSASIVLPRDVPVRIESESGGWFSSIDIHKGDLEEVDDDVFESPGFRDAKTRIVIEVDVGMGSVDFYFK